MGGLRGFIRKVMLDGRTGAIEEEIDQLRSEYPPTLASGFWNSGGRTSIVAVPSTKVFHLQQMLITNNYTGTNYAYFYDGPGSSVSVGGVLIQQSNTLFLEGLKGMIFLSAVHVSTLDSAIQLRVAGIIRTST